MSHSLFIRSFYICLLIAAAIPLMSGCSKNSTDSTDTAVSTDGVLQLRVLSSRPDMVSGGDALIEVGLPGTSNLSDFNLQVNGKTVTENLSEVQPGVYRGKISNLKLGNNTVSAVLTQSEQSPVTLSLTNYPITGPIISGPHLSPFECRTEEAGLGAPLDEDCSAPQKIEYFYRATDGEFKPLTEQQPNDLAMTTTTDGVTVPYIVRVDSGVINRTIYRIAILDNKKLQDGQSSGDDWQPGVGWNNRLGVSFGGGAGTNYNQGVNQATSVLNDTFLSRGFAHVVSSELVNRQHANAILQGETLMMIKEYFIENYGLPKWTVGNGGSGGAIQQLLIAQLFPGLLNGIRPSLSYPDSTLHTADCGVLQNYWKKDEAGIWTDEKKEAVSGFAGGTCRSWERSFVPVLRATNIPGCGLKDESLVYDPVANPNGARCTIQEMRENFYGSDPDTGYARKPQDNVGVQYGLAALNNGAISVDEFLDLNENIGGNDLDGEFTSTRSVGDPIAIRAAYHFGFINSGGGGLTTVPILHYRDYRDPLGDIHDRERDLTIRARIQKALGRSDHEVIWVGPYRERDSEPAIDIGALALDTMTEWLDGINNDPAPLTTDKIVKHKPAAAVDACWSKDYSEKIVEPMSFDGNTRCNEIYPMHSEPRLVAGAPLTNDIMKCQLKPIDASDYSVKFSDIQLRRLQSIFADGVCDFSKPGIEQVALDVGWPQPQ